MKLHNNMHKIYVGKCFHIAHPCTQWRRKRDKWGPYSYIHAVHDQFLLKSIVFTVFWFENMDMHDGLPQLLMLPTALLALTLFWRLVFVVRNQRYRFSLRRDEELQKICQTIKKFLLKRR